MLWATGFARDYAGSTRPSSAPTAHRAPRRGVTASPGLYFLGMPWQHTRGSALLGWVKHDAQHVAEHISALTSRQRVLA